MVSPSTSASSESAPPGPAARGKSFVGWLEDRFFPPAGGPTGNSRGVLTSRLAEAPALLVALAIGLIVAGILESTMLARPITAGGDPGQWTSTAYAYVGLPYPSWIIPGQYPPLLFPLLGVLIRIAGGPINGARAYVGVVAVLLGLSYYFLARGLTRRRSTALLAESIVLLNPTFLQMFFWGFYPNLLAFVFANLCLGFLVRFVRSRRPEHAFLFWTFGAATLLTHSLVGTVLVGVAAIAFVLMLSIKVLPREVFHSRAGGLGILLVLASVGGFYALTALLHIPHPSYFNSGAFAYVRNGIASIFNLLVRPFVRSIKISPTEAVPLLWVMIAGIAVYALGIRLFWKSRLTLGTIVTISLALAPISLAAGGWELAIVTDYSRFSYFLIAPLGLAIALTIDRLMTELRARAATSVPDAAPPGALGLPSTSPRWRPPVSVRDPRGALIVFGIASTVIVLVAGAVTLPSLPTDEHETTRLGHDYAFLGALGLIRSNGQPGSVLTVPGVAKWTRAILVRDAYFPNLAARYTFDPTHLVDEETTYFAMTTRYAATNGVVAVTALGTNPSSGTGTFEYQPAYFGVFTPVAALPVANLTVRLLHNGSSVVSGVTAVPSVNLAPSGNSSFELVYAEPGFTLTVTAVAVPGVSEAALLLNATATAGYSIVSVAGNLTGPTAGTAKFEKSTSAGNLVLTPGKFGSSLATSVRITPAAALKTVTPFNHPGAPAHAGWVLAPSASSGTNSVAVTFLFETSLASNLISGLPPLITTDQVWANWTVRYVLYSTASSQEAAVANLLPNELVYLITEYGARVLGTSGTWTVLVVPAVPVLARPSVAPAVGETGPPRNA